MVITTATFFYPGISDQGLGSITSLGSEQRFVKVVSFSGQRLVEVFSISLATVIKDEDHI